MDEKITQERPKKTSNNPNIDRTKPTRPNTARPKPARPEGARPTRPEGTKVKPTRPEGPKKNPVNPERTKVRPVEKPAEGQGVKRPRRTVEQSRAKRLSEQHTNVENKPLERPVRANVRTTGSNEMKIRAASKKRKQQQRTKGLLVAAFILMILAIVGSIGGMLYMKKYGLSDEEMNATKYYDITRDADLVVVLDTEILGVGGMVANDVAYISYDTVLDYLNNRFYWDANENVLMYTLEDGTVEANLGDSEYSKGSTVTQTDYQIVKTEGSEVYIAVEYVQIYTNIDFTFYEEPYRISITSEWGDIDTVTVKKDTQVRYQAGVKSPIISYVEEGDVLTYLTEEEEIEDWTKVCTADGYVGYIQTKNIGSVVTETISREFEEQVYTNISLDYTINMAWHQVTSSAANDTILSAVADTEGLTTIAPTWFFIDSTDGSVTSYASSTYVNYAHKLGMDVWAVLNDFDGSMNSQAETYETLSNSDAREKIINTVIAAAIETGIDGINVDIENVSTECGEHYIQFIRELSVKCRQNGLVLSVDNYPPKAYNMHYDYEEQGIVADYVIIMGYDEHYSGSLEAGSVSSISYVEDSIVEMLTMVDADKIISGIPFYTRLWTSTLKTDEELAAQEGTEEAEYAYNVSSQAYGMTAAENVVEEAGVDLVWDDTTKQYYASWTVENSIYEIWIEDETSIEEKLKLMQTYELAGTAAWKLGFETSSIWNVIEKYVN